MDKFPESGDKTEAQRNKDTPVTEPSRTQEKKRDSSYSRFLRGGFSCDCNDSIQAAVACSADVFQSAGGVKLQNRGLFVKTINLNQLQSPKVVKRKRAPE